MVAMVLQSDLGKAIKGQLLARVEEALPDLVETIFKQIEEKISFRSLIQARIEAFELDHLERIVLKIASRELRTIEWLGGVLGLLIGLLQLSLAMHY
jgi:uncharacterized membrane protein YheB (UPF0754 family)